MRGIRGELNALRQERVAADPRIDDLIEMLDGMGAELARLGESQRTALRLLAEREVALLKPAPTTVTGGG